MNDYAAACERAATAQGLDPFAEAMAAAGVEYGIAQTGGFTMVLTVPTPLGVFGMIDDGLPGVVWYAPGTWDTGEEQVADWTTSPEGVGRLAKVLALMQSYTPETIGEPSMVVCEWVGLDGTGREDGPHDWRAVLDAAMDMEQDVAPEPEVMTSFVGDDNVRVVQIDTNTPGRIRINLNDAAIWDGDPDTHEHESCSTCH